MRFRSGLRKDSKFPVHKSNSNTRHCNALLNVPFDVQRQVFLADSHSDIQLRTPGGKYTSMHCSVLHCTAPHRTTHVWGYVLQIVPAAGEGGCLRGICLAAWPNSKKKCRYRKTILPFIQGIYIPHTLEESLTGGRACSPFPSSVVGES